jgi:hypothetical protein
VARQRSLESLDLEHCRNVGDAGLARLASCTELEVLKLHYCQRVTDAGLAHLAKLARLRSLDLSYCERVEGEALATLRGLTVLKAPTLAALAKAIHLGGLRSLEKLNVPLLELAAAEELEPLAALTRLTDLETDGVPSKKLRKAIARLLPKCWLKGELQAY